MHQAIHTSRIIYSSHSLNKYIYLPAAYLWPPEKVNLALYMYQLKDSHFCQGTEKRQGQGEVFHQPATRSTHPPLYRNGNFRYSIRLSSTSARTGTPAPQTSSVTTGRVLDKAGWLSPLRPTTKTVREYQLYYNALYRLTTREPYHSYADPSRVQSWLVVCNGTWRKIILIGYVKKCEKPNLEAGEHYGAYLAVCKLISGKYWVCSPRYRGVHSYSDPGRVKIWLVGGIGARRKNFFFLLFKKM